MKKIVFIVPYFGNFKNYFQLFLNSCATNSNYNWLIFTDNKQKYEYPDNVKVQYMSLEDLKRVIEKRMGFEVSLDRAYKLCDYKPAYGYIFEEYIKEYDYWGHCDTDVIFGDLSSFLENCNIDNYDKAFFLGHCTLYRNTIENNRRFMLKLNGIYRYKEVFSKKEICAFDEQFDRSVNDIYRQYNFSVLNQEYEANLYTKSSNFKITRYDFSKSKYVVEKRTNSFFAWENGKLFRYLLKDDKIVKEEYMYIHLQLRNMQVKLSDMHTNRYKIIPNAFEKLEFDNIDTRNFSKIKKKNFNLQYLRLKFRALKSKLYAYYNRSM